MTGDRLPESFRASGFSIQGSILRVCAELYGYLFELGVGCVGSEGKAKRSCRGLRSRGRREQT
eukprot:3237669-Rhodomonas_salina.3